ncbi:FecR family protein [Flavobacterium rhizosphaerae]|uniref:FecR domain-containing protein n=1 Tax=Flavobacterium rhizosphaerae TaxID=3163298 RepID=A0ABW8YU91_9FLAO
MANQQKHYLHKLIENAGKKTGTEEELLENFMASEYRNAGWDDATMGSRQAASEKILTGIQKRIQRKKRLKRSYIYIAAASIALVLGISFFTLHEPQVKMLSFKTGNAVDSIHLQDGSSIYLSANSVLKYPEYFTGNERNVTLLKGNAFFDVAKNPQHPFIITSGKLKTRVLGTSFHIRLLKDRCNVVVLTGRVKVTSPTQHVNLVPGEEALFKTGSLTKRNAHKRKLVNWYTQDINLDNVTLDEVIRVLRYKYGVGFEPENDKILDKKLTVYILKDAALNDVLQQINYITNLKFEHYAETIKIIDTP